MNKELYEQLLNANRVFSEIKEKENIIELEKAKIEEYEETSRQLMEKTREKGKLPVDKRLRLGILFGFIGTILLIGLALSVFVCIFGGGGDDIMSAVVLLAILGIPPFIVATFLLRSYFREKRDVIKECETIKREAEEYCNNTAVCGIEKSKKEIASKEDECRELIEANKDALRFLPDAYCNSFAVPFMLKCVEEGYADSLKTAIMLCDMKNEVILYEEKNRKLEAAVEKLKEQLEKELTHIEELNKKLGQSNSSNSYVGWAVLDSIFDSL